MVPVLVILASVGQAGWSPPPTASCRLDESWWRLAAWEVDPLRPTVVLVSSAGDELFLWSPLEGAAERLRWDGPHIDVVSSSDVTGDGQLDLVIRTEDEAGGDALGALVDPDDVSDVMLFPSESVGWGLTGLGDVDGDGAGDVAFGQELWVSTPNVPWLTLGGTVGQDTYDQHVFRLGDVDGDGIDDLAVTAWSGGYHYGDPYGPLEVLLGDELLPTLGGTIGSTDDTYGFGIVDVNVDADAAREFLFVHGDIVDDYGGVRGALTLVDDLASGLVELATSPFATYDYPAGVGGTDSHKLLPLREGSSSGPAVVAWINDERIEELELTGPGSGPAEIRSVAVYLPPDDWMLTDGLASDLDHDGTIDLVAVGTDTYTYQGKVVAWLRSADGATLSATTGTITCQEPEPPPPDPDPLEPQPNTDTSSCGCSSGLPAGGGTAILLWLVAVRRRRC